VYYGNTTVTCHFYGQTLQLHLRGKRMTRLAFFTIFLTIPFYGCSDKPLTAKHNPTFKSFEVSYTNGWTRGFSFIVDTNKIFFSPQRLDTIYYGILPDTICKMLDTTFLKIHNNQNIKSKDEGCMDCSVLSIKIISNGDTTRINQIGDLDNIFYPLIKSLQTFIDSNKHQTIQAVIQLETRLVVAPPPPKIDETKFKPPLVTKKSGR
jgi:hypothetical protein